MKKAIILLMASIMILGVVGCNNVEGVDSKGSSPTAVADNNAEDSQIEDITVEENIEDDIEEEETYTHTAITGAVIIEQDGGIRFAYKGLCDECGKTDSVTKYRSASSGTFKSGYLCSCGNQQEIEIESELE